MQKKQRPFVLCDAIVKVEQKTDHVLAKQVLYSYCMTYAMQSHRRMQWCDVQTLFLNTSSLTSTWTLKITGVLSQKRMVLCFWKRSLQCAWIFSTSTKQQSSVLCPSSRVLWYLVRTCGSSQLLFKNEKKWKEKELFSFNSTWCHVNKQLYYLHLCCINEAFFINCNR